VNPDLDATGMIMTMGKTMIATMIMDMIEEIAIEDSDSNQQKETAPTCRDGFLLFICI
jgi:hypothetical protein